MRYATEEGDGAEVGLGTKYRWVLIPAPILTPQPQVYCGRYISAHMLQHYEGSGHPMVLSYVDLSTWCYQCQAYVHHQVGPRQTL